MKLEMAQTGQDALAVVQVRNYSWKWENENKDVGLEVETNQVVSLERRVHLDITERGKELMVIVRFLLWAAGKGRPNNFY